MLVVYVEDFKLSGPEGNLKAGSTKLRAQLSIEGEVPLDKSGATFLGCRQIRTTRRMPDGSLATVMEYDMEEFLLSCIEKYKELAGVKDVRPCMTPFLPEEHTHSPAGRAGDGPCVECPWCKHTFPPTIHESVSQLEASLLAQKKNKPKTRVK